MSKWTVNQLERNADDGGVINIHWSCSETDGEYSGSTYGSLGVTPDASAPNFVAYENLTEEVVIGWLHEAMGEETVAAHEAAVAAQIAEAKAPKVATGMPWTPV